jgi:uncharacterized membrane protein
VSAHDPEDLSEDGDLGEWWDLPDPLRRALAISVAVLAVVTVAAMVVLRPTGENRPKPEALGVSNTFYDARVVGIDENDCPEAVVEGAECATVTFRLLEGPDPGREVPQDFYDLGVSTRLELGSKVVMAYNPDVDASLQYTWVDQQRKPVLAWLAVAFAAVVVLLGRWRGVAALVGLAGSLGVLLWFILPAILDGRSPLLVAIVGSIAIAYLALYVAHGFTTMTTIALIGTIASLLLTAVLAVVVVEAAAFSGFADEEAGFLQLGAAQVDIRGLVLAGIVIGALGAIDDMTVTQASAVWELHVANPDYTSGRLYRSAMQIGRDHVASTVNTLFLAYAGASLPLMLLFVIGEQALTSVANFEVVAVEIVRTLVGSIGLVAAVPLTTWLAALVAPRGADQRGYSYGESGSSI